MNSNNTYYNNGLGVTFLISPQIANHPALQKNLLTLKEDRPPEKDIDKVRWRKSIFLIRLELLHVNIQVLKEIRGAAMDGLNFLEVRKSFWETSEPPGREAGRKCLRRSRSEQSSRTRVEKIKNSNSKLSLLAV